MRLSSASKTGLIIVLSASAGIMTGFLFRWSSEEKSAGSGQRVQTARAAPGGGGSGKRREPRLPHTRERIRGLLQAGIPSRQIAAALELARLTSVDEIRDLLDHSGDFPDNSSEEVGVGTLLRRWLELDPESAVEYCRLRKPDFLARLAGDWHRVQPGAAEAFVHAMPPGDSLASAWTEICRSTIASSPDKTWELLARTPGLNPDYGTWQIDSTVNQLVRQDVRKAMAGTDTMPPAVLKAARKSIASELMKTDPAQGWEWARSQPNPEDTLGAALGAVLGSDPAQALDFMKSLPVSELRRVLEQSGYDWQLEKVKDLASLLTKDKALDPAAKADMADRLFGRAIWSNPAEAQALIPLLNADRLKGHISQYIQSWARGDAAAAREWAESLPEGAVRDSARRALEAFDNPESTLDRTSPESLVEEFAQGQYLTSSDPRLASVTVDQLRRMVSEVPANQSYRLQQMMTALAASNPALAGQWLEQTSLDTKSGPAAAQFSALWAENDPAAAAAWVKTLPPGDLAKVAAVNVARQYALYDPAGALSWVGTLPAGAARDAARLGMLQATDGNP